MIRNGALARQGQLRRFAPVQHLFRPAARPLDTFESNLVGDIDEDDMVAHLRPPSLDQEGRIDHEQRHRIFPTALHLLVEAVTNARVDERFEVSKRDGPRGTNRFFAINVVDAVDIG